MKLYVRPLRGYQSYRLVEIEVDPTDKCSIIKEKYREKVSKLAHLNELFYNTEALAEDRTIAYYGVQDGSIIESCSNPVWLALLQSIHGEMEERYGADYKNLVNLKKYIGQLTNSKHKNASQPDHFPTIDEWINGVELAPRSPNLQQNITTKYAEYRVHLDNGTKDPLGDFIKEQYYSKNLEKVKYLDDFSPKKTPPKNKTNQPPREYVPLESKSAYALLIALYRASQEVPSRPSLSEPELKLDAHNYTMADLSDRVSVPFSGFDVMEYLLAKKLVLREGTGNSLRYTLTADARPLAQKCSEFCEAAQSLRERAGLRMSAPSKLSLVLIIDSKEPQHVAFRDYLTNEHINVEVRRLPVGDFLWVARSVDGEERILPYLIERKSHQDLVDSINDLRYYRQKQKMLACGIPNLVYLFEGQSADIKDKKERQKIMEQLNKELDNTLASGFMVARPQSTRGTVLYLKHLTYWLQKKYDKMGEIPMTYYEFKAWQDHSDAGEPTHPNKVEECTLLSAEAFTAFILDSEYRANFNHDFPKGGLIVVQGFEKYRSTRHTLLNKILRDCAEQGLDCTEQLTARLKESEMISPELFSYHLAVYYAVI